MSALCRAYVRAALWSSTDDNGEPLDRNHDVGDIATSTLRKMAADCLRFKKKARRDLEEISDSDAGHDFWLTRNGHGAGFWDRGLGAAGDRLSRAAKSFGSYDLYVGDDGKIHGSR